MAGNAKVFGLISDPALMSIGKALIQICHYIPKERELGTCEDDDEHNGRSTPRGWRWCTLCVNESDDRLIMISVKHFGLSTLSIKIHNLYLSKGPYKKSYDLDMMDQIRYDQLLLRYCVRTSMSTQNPLVSVTLCLLFSIWGPISLSSHSCPI